MALDNSLDIFFEVMEIGFNPEAANGLDLLFKYTITGPRGGEWYLKIKDSRLSIERDRADSPAAGLTISDGDFIKLNTGRLNAEEAVSSGRLKFKGDPAVYQLMQSTFAGKQYLSLTDGLYDYMLDVSLREPDVLKRLRRETMDMMPANTLMIPPDQGQFLAWLCKVIQAGKTLDIGVFTGYSSLAMALALPEDGEVIACDISEKWTEIAGRYWAEAGVAHKISLRLAPAVETLDSLLKDGRAGGFDLAFIDADKQGYDAYYERCLQLVRPGGLIILDNTLFHAWVINPHLQHQEIQGVRAINEKLLTDDRVEISMLPHPDGLTLALKK
ncbi:MAG: class I SAM-dependent methyltransferase [Deltaproteobacteria bacterium]|nr:class I SAM-dependent methyltransferase [Deltaproteobacteria bacterium]